MDSPLTIVKGSPFHIDWTDKNAVIAYAKKLGPGQLVFKHPDRKNYNITHCTRWKDISPEWVVFETGTGREQ